MRTKNKNKAAVFTTLQTGQKESVLYFVGYF
jgi:hypothetical protein